MLEAAINPRYLPAKFPAGLASLIVCFGHFPGSLADGSDDDDDAELNWTERKATNSWGVGNKFLGVAAPAARQTTMKLVFENI